MKRFLLLIINLWFLLPVFSQTEFQLEKLEDFSKIYGVMRYFHPSDESAKMNWNRFALYGVKEILKIESEEEFTNTIKKLFAPVAPSLSFEGNEYKWEEKESLHPVYWRHRGLGLGKIKESRYKSERLNRALESDKLLAYRLNLENLQYKSAKKVRLIYKAKTKSGGDACAWLNLFDESNKSVSSKNTQASPITNISWEPDTILLNIDGKNFTKINFGFIAKNGTAEFKDIKLEILNKNRKWSKIKLPDFTDERWSALNDSKYEASKNHLTLKNDFKPSEYKKILIKESHISVQLSNGLTATVPIIVYSDKANTLPVSSDFESLQDKINSMEKNKFSKEVSIANVIITWNIFHHFFPYQEEVKIDWKNEIRKAIKDAFDDKTKHEGILTLRRFTEIFNDGHISINNIEIQSANETFAPPITWKLIEGKLVVSKVMDENLEINTGDIVDKINEQNSKQYLDSISQYISGSKQWKEFRSLQEGLKGKKNDKLDLTLKNGKILQLLKDKSYTRNIDFYTREDTVKIKELNDILYINLCKLDSATAIKNISKIKSYKKIIFDLRGYPKRGTNELLINFFSNKSKQENFHIPIIFYPYLQNAKWMNNAWKYKQKDSLEAEIALIIDERAISFAESTTAYLKENGYVTIIGKPTAGANGNINEIKLLDENMLIFTGMKVTNYDGSQFHSIGIKPDIYVEEKVEDIVTGRDVFIEKAIEFFNEK